MEEKNQQDRLLGVNRELGDDSEGRVKFEGASQEYEFSREESEGEENNREVKDDPLDSSSLEGRVKGEGENRGYESSSEESVGEENNRDKRDTDESIEEKEKGVEDNIGNCVTDEGRGRSSNGAQAVHWGNV